MDVTIFIFIVGMIFVMVIGAVNSSRRKTNSPKNYDTTNTSDFVFFNSDLTHHSHHHHHHGHVDHNSCSDFTHGDSGSFDSGGCDSGGGGCD